MLPKEKLMLGGVIWIGMKEHDPWCLTFCLGGIYVEGVQSFYCALTFASYLS